MGAAEPLYRVRVNSSGLIYAVIVGAWAAYLVPMWLRRQDELNESRPTERFSTAIRLLSGKAAMERRYSKGTERRDDELPEDQSDFAASGLGDQLHEPDDVHEGIPDAADEGIDVRAYADPKTMVGGAGVAAPTEVHAGPAVHHAVDEGQGEDVSADGARGEERPNEAKLSAAERSKARQSSKKRAKVLARRRRTTMALFLAFTAGTVVAAVGGLSFLWAPAGPGVLLSAYIVHLRVQERRRFAVTMDKRQGEAAAQRLRERRIGPSADAGQETEAVAADVSGREPEPQPVARQPVEEPGAADRRALVEQTDHAEWVDQQRHGGREPDGGWDPAPVPLPTYVSAPVAPRSTRGVDLEGPGTWSSARSSAASGETSPAGEQEPDGDPSPGSRRGRGKGRTPLFDQYEDGDRPRAANE
ncbi:MAG TPA: gephyrin-like molybdotransferase receptor GlpR [Streptomyces sp.]|nr:gephyrin-like molybdotransferase receptor GlpR [Streptomyces sp.]